MISFSSNCSVTYNGTQTQTLLNNKTKVREIQKSGAGLFKLLPKEMPGSLLLQW